MPYYPSLKRKAYKARAVDRLLALKKQIRRELPTKTASDTLLLATWNIRDFDSNKFKHGPRLPESIFYIAEVINSFDIVAVQEVSDDLRALRKVMEILGPRWNFLVTDVTQGTSGNSERMAFLYDERKVLFRNVAGQVVLPQGQGIVDREIIGADGSITRIEKQFARTPFLCTFQAGWFEFSLCTVHLYFGADSGKKLRRRVREIRAVAKAMAKRARKEKVNFFVLGDFNIVSPEHETMESLLKEGFEIPEPLQRQPSNLWKNKYYDQLAFKGRSDELRLGESEPNAGVFDPFKSAFRTRDAADYYDDMPPDKIEGLSDAEKKEYYKKVWRTFQLSDHLVMWLELKVDFSDDYLKRIKEKD